MDQNPKVGIAGNRLEDPDGTPHSAPAFRFQSPARRIRAHFDARTCEPKLLYPLDCGSAAVNYAIETDWFRAAA